MDAPRIDEFRLTFVFGRTVLSGVTGAVGPGGTLAFARERTSYADWFDTVAPARTDVAPAPGSYSPPWPAHAGQGFWQSYLGLDEKDQPLSIRTISGREAYRQLIPVRVALPLLLEAPLADARVASEGLIWPWGVAIAVTLTHRRPLAGFKTPVEAAFALRDGSYWCRRTRANGPLESHVAKALDRLVADAFGDAPAQPWAKGGPFSLHSTIRGAGQLADFDPAKTEVHALLQAVTSFSPTWEDDNPLDLEKLRVAGLQVRPKQHITMALRRGCAVWAPAHFLAASGGIHTVGCHHRNLIMATAQTQSLLRFVIATRDWLAAPGSKQESDYRWLAGRASGALVRLWAGSKGCYRSGVVEDYVEREDEREAINTVREWVDQDPIAFSKAGG